MNLKNYIKDKITLILIYIFMFWLLTSMMMAFKIPTSYIIILNITILLFITITFIISYYKRKIFYNHFISTLEQLDQKYLISEMIEKPNFLEGDILYQSIYEIDKSMNEKINNLQYNLNDFKEYMELWIHEVKLPISSLILMTHKENTKDKKKLEQIQKIENYVEQVLYYVRSENAGVDYLIHECNLEDIIKNTALKNKDIFLLKNIQLKVENVNRKVLTDSKWLEFILNQIINNSIKYKTEKLDSYIEINTIEKDNKIILSIYDNGIGISSSDIGKVFEKSFTGQNGRKVGASTGMGLYICKKLCQKLGHNIEIESKENRYTKVTLEFNHNKFYDVIK